MLPKVQYWLKTQAGRFSRAYNSLNVPPMVRMGLLIAAAVVPFVIFVVFQAEDTPETVAAQQEPVDLTQRAPLQFPFGELEASPTPSPSPTASPTESASPRPSPRTRRTTNRSNPQPPPAAAPAAQPAPPEPSPEPQPEPSPEPSPAASSPAAAPKPPPPPPPSPSPSPSRSGPITVCNDGKDNDGDGKIDMDDVGCFDSEDDDE